MIIQRLMYEFRNGKSNLHLSDRAARANLRGLNGSVEFRIGRQQFASLRVFSGYQYS